MTWAPADRITELKLLLYLCCNIHRAYYYYPSKKFCVGVKPRREERESICCVVCYCILFTTTFVCHNKNKNTDNNSFIMYSSFMNKNKTFKSWRLNVFQNLFDTYLSLLTCPWISFTLLSSDLIDGYLLILFSFLELRVTISTIISNCPPLSPSFASSLSSFYFFFLLFLLNCGSKDVLYVFSRI